MQASRHCFPVSKKLGLLLAGAGLSAATSSLRDRTRDMPGLGFSCSGVRRPGGSVPSLPSEDALPQS
eukprot:scaffold288295_cov19-Tisochrysis_lutea.AAC.1